MDGGHDHGSGQPLTRTSMTFGYQNGVQKTRKDLGRDQSHWTSRAGGTHCLTDANSSCHNGMPGTQMPKRLFYGCQGVWLWARVSPKATNKAIDFRQIQAIARSLVVHTWCSSRKLAQGIYTLGRDPSSGKGSLRQVILDRRADLVRTAIGCSFAPKNCILMAWFSAMLSSWCDLDVTGQGNRFFRT